LKERKKEGNIKGKRKKINNAQRINENRVNREGKKEKRKRKE